MSLRAALLVATAASACAVAWAQGTPATAPPSAAQPSAREAADPSPRLRVEEDDNVRIEELRVRGETRRIVVKPKTAGAKEYEIVPTSGARDPSQRDGRAGGERVWRVFSF